MNKIEFEFKTQLNNNKNDLKDLKNLLFNKELTQRFGSYVENESNEVNEEMSRLYEKYESSEDINDNKVVINNEIIERSVGHKRCEDREQTNEGMNGLDVKYGKQSNEKCFKCDFNDCNKIYKWKTALSRHKLIHLNKRFVCDWNECGKTFTRNEPYKKPF